MHELQPLEPILDVRVSVKQSPDELGGLVLEHQQNEAFVDAQVALGDPGLVAVGFGGVAVGVVEAVFADQAWDLDVPQFALDDHAGLAGFLAGQASSD